jgi:hypothetical protein
MMSRRGVFASVAGAVMASSACVAYPSNPWFEQKQSPAPQVVPNPGVDAFTPAVTQAGGEREEGPRVTIAAEVQTPDGSRLVRANFHLDDDAYVLVGHIDADGVLRIEFPETPLDNGFAKGHASYQTAQFFAGFTGQYRARFASGLNRPTGAAASDSYDGGTGYVFIIASWQPLHFEKFSSGGEWDAFEVVDAENASDPRPAVYELAASLAGTNPSTYTVRFARAFNTYSPFSPSSAWDARYSDYANTLGAQTCSGPGYGYSFGFPSSPFADAFINPILTYGYGQSFWWRGSLYSYSPAGDCYYSRSSAFGYALGGYGGYNGFGYGGFGYGGFGYYGQTVAQSPTIGGRFIGINRIRPPVSPQGNPVNLAPSGVGTDAGGAITSKVTLAPETTSPQYRTRGLVSHEDPAGTEVIAPRAVGGNSHGNDAGSQNSPRSVVIRNGNDSRGQAGQDNGSSNRKVQSSNQPHTDAPHVVPRTEASHASPPPARVETPHSEPARSAPPASSTSSSSSTGKPPSKN